MDHQNDWYKRIKLINGTNKNSIEKWIQKNQSQYESTIQIKEHPTDGWVAYIQK
jgi:hypothetical protein